MKHFKKAICIKEGLYKRIEFKVGDIYAIVGNNNASQLVYSDENGDTQIMMLYNYSDNTMCEWTEDSESSIYPQFTFLED